MVKGAISVIIIFIIEEFVSISLYMRSFVGDVGRYFCCCFGDSAPRSWDAFTHLPHSRMYRETADTRPSSYSKHSTEPHQKVSAVLCDTETRQRFSIVHPNPLYSFPSSAWLFYRSRILGEFRGEKIQITNGGRKTISFSISQLN